MDKIDNSDYSVCTMHCLEIRITKKTSRQDLAQIDRGFYIFFLLFSSRMMVRQALVSVFVSARDQIQMELKVLVLVS